MNWILAEDLAREHIDALRRAAEDVRRPRTGGGRRRGWRRALGTKLVKAGLAVAAGVRAARIAPDVVADALCSDCVAGEVR